MRVGAQISRNLINDLGRNKGFIALHIDNNMVVSQTQFRHDFLQAVCAGRVLYRRHAYLSTKCLSDLYYTAIIGCNHDPLGPALTRLLPDPLHHRLALYLEQRLAWQSGRPVTRRYNYCVCHAKLRVSTVGADQRPSRLPDNADGAAGCLVVIVKCT